MIRSCDPLSALSGRRLAAVALALLASVPAARAEAPMPPPYYAIDNVRVAIGDGRVVEGATVLLADGLIEAVGTDLALPGDAWAIDGTGLTLYPGLIDGLTTLGQQPAAEEAGPPRGGGPGGPPAPEIRGPEDRPKTTPWVSAADLQGDDDRVAKWREAGFTTAVSAPADGIFAGRAAVISLSAVEPRERVVSDAVAQRVSFPTGGFRFYPGSLMGVIAYVEQVLSDATHYGEVEAIYTASPRGRERPTYDRTLAPLAAAIAGHDAFLLPADEAREIDRALALAHEYALTPVLYGGRAAYARAETLAAAKAAVLVDVDWPEEPKDRDAEADTPFRTLYHRRMAPTSPAALAAAKVPFAFYSGDLTSPSEILANVRQAVAAGLAADQALVALTSGAARIFGVDDRLGTVEKGKIANLVLATAEPWAENAEIRMVFVDGRKYEKRPDEEPHEAPLQDVSGTWAMTLQTPRGTHEFTAELEMAEDGKVTGDVEGEQGKSTVEEGRMSGDMLRFKVTRTMGGQSVQASYSLEVEEDAVSGTVSAGPMTMDLSGERTARREAGDQAAGKAAEAAAVGLDELQAVMNRYQGPVRDLGSFAITNARVYTLADEVLEHGIVVVAGGKIRAVGEDLAVPAGAEVIDAAGGSLIPGIIDAHSHIAVDGGVNEGSLAVTSMVGVADALNPDDIDIYHALAGGVTSANILHGSANPIGGRNAVIKLRWGADADGLRFAGAPPGIKFALGENPKRSNFRSPAIPQRYPQTRMGVMDVIREAFNEAREYRRELQDYRAALAAGRQPLPPRRDLELEPLVEILEGRRLVHAHCYRADEILQLMRLAEEEGFKIATLQHVLEGYKVADEIAAHGAGASTFSDWWGYKVEAYDAIPQNAALMAERGVLVSINSDSGEEMRHLNQEAAKTMKWGGVSELDALAMVTLNPAKQLRIDRWVGSIEVGKDADLVLYDGPPLDVGSVVQKTIVDGVLYFDRAADRERQMAIDAIKARLLGKGEETAEPAGDEAGPEADPTGPARHGRAVAGGREEG
jgi:imidazolonepropionase-like amidohydrolase